MQKVFNELWKWNGSYLKFSDFNNNVMQGNLKKRAKEKSFFKQKLYYLRYFLIDYQTGNIYIATHVEYMGNFNNCTKIPFGGVLDCSQPSELEEISLQKEMSKTYCYPFYVKTNERDFTLCAASEEERQMWMAGFKYVMISTKQVQQIIKAND